MSIRAVFFDSGHTLVRPLGGAWFPGHRFWDICAQHEIAVPRDAIDAASHVGMIYLDEQQHACPDVAAELEQFAEYYRILFRELGVTAPHALPQTLAAAMVGEVNFEPYENTVATLETIRGLGLDMAVITDAWPSARPKYAASDMLKYFGAFVISAEQRITKPDWAMFNPALVALGVDPGEVLFVDDAVDLIERTAEMGFVSVLADFEGVHRDFPRRIERIDEITSWLK